jgi:molecular chaperone DnaK
MVEGNRALGRFQLTDVPPAPRGIPQIEVTFDIDANGIIEVTAKDKGTGKVQNIKIESGGSLSDEDIERMKQEAEMNSDDDNRKKEEATKLNEADATIFQTEKQIKELEDKIDEESKASLEKLISELKDNIEKKDFDGIDTTMENINSTWSEVTTKMYEQTDVNEEKKDDMEDVEFEEVK